METPKLLIWMNCPSHHQSAFFQALRDRDVDLVVHYVGELSEERRKQGWEEADSLPPGERYVDASTTSLERCPDWRDRVHVVGGMSLPLSFLITLTTRLTLEEVDWMPWMEHVWDLHPTERISTWPRWLVKYAVYHLYGRCIDRWGSGALAISRLGRDAFQSWGVDGDDIGIVPYAVPGLDPETSSDATLLDFGRDAAPLYLYLGTLCHRKAIDVLLKAFARVSNEAPEAKLALVGRDQADGRYHELANSLGLDDEVLFRGPIPSDEVAGAIELSDVCVLPSRNDGWGMFPNEAFSLGRPVVATRMCGSGRHLVQEGENGFLVDIEDPEALSRAMLEYARHPELIERHGESARERFQRFTPEANAERMIRAVRELT